MVAFVAGGWSGLLRTLPAVLVLSAVMGVAQYLLVTNGLWTLGATGGAMAGLLVGLRSPACPLYRGTTRRAACLRTRTTASRARCWRCLSAYTILVVLAFAINLIPPLSAFLDRVSFTLHFPELSTAYGWVTPAESWAQDQPVRPPRRHPAVCLADRLLHLQQSGLLQARARPNAFSTRSAAGRSTPAWASWPWWAWR